MAQGESELHPCNFLTAWTVHNPPYVIFKWSIEKFSEAKHLTLSPPFDVCQTSRWYMTVDPDVADGQDRFVAFRLKMAPNRQRCAKLMVTGEFSVHDPANRLIFDKTFKEVYGDSGFEFRLPKVCFSLRSERDVYLARCEMIISKEKDLTNDWEPHLERLSTDFENLYFEKRFADVSVRASDDVIGVHKAVLSARSKALLELLAADDCICEQAESSVILGAVLLFVYTGNPDLLLSSIPVEMYGRVAVVASKWKMDELASLLTPAKISCKTGIRCKYFLYTWQVKNFSKLSFDARGFTFSDEFTFGENARWKLMLKKTGETYGLYLEKICPDSVSHAVDVKFCMYNRKSKYKVRKSREFVFASRQTFGFSSFANETYLQSNVLKDDILMIDCRLKLLLESESQVAFKEKFIDVSDEDSTALKYLKSFSRHLKELHLSERWSDITLLSDNVRVSAHRAVLWARSPYFRENLCHSSEDFVKVPIEREILNETLLYMYSAELPNLNWRNVLGLYESCHLLRLAELGNVCRLFMSRNLNVGVVLEVIESAHVLRDRELENTAMDFVCIPGNAKMIINAQRWITFRENYNHLAIRIYHKLAWDYCNHVCRQ